MCETSKPMKPLARAAKGPARAVRLGCLQRWLMDLRLGLVYGLCLLAVVTPSGVAPLANALQSANDPWAGSVNLLPHMDQDSVQISAAVRQMVIWSVTTRDHAGMPFVVVDKPQAHLYLFDASAHLVAHSPVLLGSAHGDHTVPGIGDKAIDDVRPDERTTPAGRFLGRMGENLSGENVVWVDYDAAVSMHRVRANRASEQRLERLASETADDNRISYGCINVPVAFFETHLLPLFATRAAPIYVLPERESLTKVFGMTR